MIYMEIRRCTKEDLPEIARLFFDTITTVNASDYTKQQIAAWSGRCQSLLSREDFLSSLYTLVAISGGIIVGYGNIDSTGYIDHLYTHKDFQHRGIATKICNELEKYAYERGAKKFTVHASVTALPFFIHRGYQIVKEHQAEIDGLIFINFLCAKNI